MTTPEVSVVHDETATMRDLLGTMHANGYSDLDEIRQFLVIYLAKSSQIENDGRDAEFALYESLDMPEIGLEFYEGTFDDLLAVHDNLGGTALDMHYPDLDLSPANDWTQKQEELQTIFSDEYRAQVGKWHPDVFLARDYARYVLEHHAKLKATDLNEVEYGNLLGNPNFVKALSHVYDFQDEQDEASQNEMQEVLSAGEFLTDVMEAVGYQYSATWNEDWARPSSEYDKENVTPNVIRMLKLEAERPGAVRVLSEFYGIRNFGRYSLDLLTNQFDTHGDASRPYGIVMLAVDDHNGAFKGYAPADGSIIPDFYKEVQPTHNLRVCEAGSKSEFKERLAKLDVLYGNHQKIQFAAIEAHGSNDAIQLGRTENIGSIALTAKLGDVHSFFAPDACIALNSCSTGQLNGIGQSLSRQLKAIVVGPMLDASMKRLRFTQDASGVRLIPEYGEAKTRAAIYKNGRPLGIKATEKYLTIK